MTESLFYDYDYEGVCRGLLAAADAVLHAKGKAVIAVDGCAAAGKTTFAAWLARRLGAAVVHTDDFFLPPEMRTAQRYAQPGGNIDYERFIREVAPALLSGDAVSYRRFDCASGEKEKIPVTLQRSAVTVIEGSYSMHPQLASLRDIGVFAYVSPEEQIKRITARNGEKAADVFRNRWIPLENGYFEYYGIRGKADFVYSFN